MSTIQQSIRDISELMTGGLQITTGLNGRSLPPPKQSTPYTGKQFEAKGIRTVIQPDMDVMTMLSPEVLGMDGLWEQHMAVVEQKLDSIRNLQQWVQQSWVLLMVFPTAWLLFNYIRVGFPDVLVSALQSAALAGIIYLSKRFIAQVLSWAVGRYLRAQLQKYIG